MAAAVTAAAGTRPDRYFLDHPIRHDGRTWAPSLAWGANAEPVLQKLIAMFPDAGVSFRPPS